jgi:hypothetical protein
MNTVVELVVDDIDKYLQQLTAAQRRALDYDVTARALRFPFIASGGVKKIRQEIEARRKPARSIPHATTAAERVATATDSFVFNARYLASLSSDRLYRIYYRDGAFYLIRIAGQGNTDALAMQFGLLGALLAGAFKGAAKSPEDVARMDEAHPESFLSQHKHNLKFTPTQVMEARIEPAAALKSHGHNFGRLILTLMDGKKLTFQFEDPRHMRCAINDLPPLLGPTLEINVRWDEEKGEYVKR